MEIACIENIDIAIFVAKILKLHIYMVPKSLDQYFRWLNWVEKKFSLVEFSIRIKIFYNTDIYQSFWQIYLNIFGL